VWLVQGDLKAPTHQSGCEGWNNSFAWIYLNFAIANTTIDVKYSFKQYVPPGQCTPDELVCAGELIPHICY